MDYETIAVTHLQSVLAKNGYLESFINLKDKEPIWDGNIYVYNIPNRQHNKKHLLGRVAVQVKGHLDTEISTQNSKRSYKFNVIDLENYLNDGGVIFFVITFDENGNNEKVFYKKFLPYDLKQILKNIGNKKTKTLSLDYFPNDKKEVLNIFYNFILDKKKQGSIVGVKEIDYKKLMKNNKEVILSCTVIDKNFDSLLKYIISYGAYLYVKTDIGNLIPIQMLEKISEIATTLPLKVMIKNVVYYTKIELVMLAEENRELRIGNSLSIKESKENGKLRIEFKLTGRLSEQIEDLNFMIAVLENGAFDIADKTFDFTDNYEEIRKSFNILEMKNYLKKLQNTNECLQFLGVSDDLDINKMQEKDGINLEVLYQAITNNRMVSLKEGTPFFCIIPIANLKIFVYTEKDKDSGKYKIFNYCDCKANLKSRNEETGEEWACPFFVVLTKENLINISNLNEEKIINALNKIEFKNNNISMQILLFFFDVLHAYDTNNKRKILCLAKDILNILKEKDKNLPKIYYRINELQICKRERMLTKDERFELFEMIKNYSTDNALIAGVYILLDEFFNAEKYLKKLTREQQDAFKSYPIYTFLKNYKEVNNEQTEV